MQGSLTTDSVIELPSLRLERLSQAASGPFTRAHEVDRPSLIYIPPPFREAARGCFGTPASHRSFRACGPAIFVPAHVPVHVHSPGFANRMLLALRMEDSRLDRLVPGPGAMDGCLDIRGRGIVETVDRIAREMDSEAPARETMLSGLALVLVGEMIRYLGLIAAPPEPERSGLADWQMNHVRARVADESLPPPHVDELAALCRLGRRQFMRAFRARTGLTAMEWVEQATFERAARMLESGNRPIKAIAADLGYSHAGSFTAAFTRRFGTAPRDWRRRH